MPLYEYVCRDCGKDSELLVRSDTEIRCEHCGSAKMDKKLSVFSAQAGSSADLPPCAGGCCGFQKGQCGSGMCGSH